MSENVIAIYCFPDDFSPEVGPRYVSLKPQAHPKVGHSSVLATAIVSARFFYSNQASAVKYMAGGHKSIILEKSAFDCSLRRLTLH